MLTECCVSHGVSPTCLAPCDPATMNVDLFDESVSCITSDLVPLITCGSGKSVDWFQWTLVNLLGSEYLHRYYPKANCKTYQWTRLWSGLSSSRHFSWISSLSQMTMMMFLIIVRLRYNLYYVENTYIVCLLCMYIVIYHSN